MSELILQAGSVVCPSSSVVVVVVHRRRPHSLNFFFSETAWPIKVKFHMEPPWGIRVVSPTFPFAPESFRPLSLSPRVVSPLVVSPPFPFAPESFRPLSRCPRVVSPPYKILFLVLLFRPQKWYKALIFLLIGDFSL